MGSVAVKSLTSHSNHAQCFVASVHYKVATYKTNHFILVDSLDDLNSFINCAPRIAVYHGE